MPLSLKHSAAVLIGKKTHAWIYDSIQIIYSISDLGIYWARRENVHSV